ncbi:MAG: DUF885 domain-containing protein [marine benthic group bacterium]|nr:DUF885 domain-containing protein [Gemmatimonadota bacterium]
MNPDCIRHTAGSVLLFAALLAGALPAAAQQDATPDLRSIVAMETSDLVGVVGRYSADREALLRRWDVAYSSDRRERLRAFYEGWLQQLDGLDMEGLGLEGRIDHVLLRSELRYELELLEREGRLAAELQSLVPFISTIAALQEARRDLAPVDPREASVVLQDLADEVEHLRTALEASLDATEGEATVPSPIVALRAARAVGSLRRDLEDWYGHYAGYDPLFTWWAESPYLVVDSALAGYVVFVRERLVGVGSGGEEPIVGDPIGADAMRSDLEHEMIAYTPEELIAIGEREYAWCEAEMVRASRDMGFGDDWHAALEHVKTLHVAPGEQPDLVRDLAWEAVAFLQERDLLTIPPLAEEVWRLEMMSPEMQKVAPFFLGGEVIQVSFPTDGMAHEDKLMSMRANNVHFSRATVHHELIPGHHLQGFMTRRYNPHRRAFGTPFWGEGWALYWEMRLWDMGFPATAEDRMGMLFWRKHRAARIIFSLKFHLGEMTPDEAIDFLVDGVGHERASATAEVRRSFNGSYSPLYQAAYMIGGMQIRALHSELVESGQMTEREFHDAILQGGTMPIEMVRARLTGVAPSRDFVASWEFDESN